MKTAILGVLFNHDSIDSIQTRDHRMPSNVPIYICWIHRWGSGMIRMYIR